MIFQQTIYFVLYWAFYMFSGAHNKPTTDSKRDPALEHDRHPLRRLLRWWERRLPRPKTYIRDNQLFEIEDTGWFWSASKSKTEPVLLKGLIKQSKAVRTWGPEFFARNYGDTRLLTLRVRSSQEKAYTSFTRALELESLPLADTIRAMFNEELDESPYYINNVTSLFMQHPELVKDLELVRLSGVEQGGGGVSDDNWSLALHFVLLAARSLLAQQV